MVVYLTGTRIGSRTGSIISLGRVVSLVRPERWRKQREPEIKDMEVGFRLDWIGFVRVCVCVVGLGLGLDLSVCV